MLDVLTATILLTAFAPIMLIIGIMIKLDSPGPVIFRQEQVGPRRMGDKHVLDYTRQALPGLVLRKA